MKPATVALTWARNHWTRRRRWEKAILILVGLCLLGALGSRYALRTLAPSLAVRAQQARPVHVRWTLAGRPGWWGTTEDPWGQPLHYVIRDGERRYRCDVSKGMQLVGEETGYYVERAGEVRFIPVKNSTNVRTGDTFPEHLPVPYSIGPNGVDDGSVGDDVLLSVVAFHSNNLRFLSLVDWVFLWCAAALLSALFPWLRGPRSASLPRENGRAALGIVVPSLTLLGAFGLLTLVSSADLSLFTKVSDSGALQIPAPVAIFGTLGVVAFMLALAWRLTRPLKE